MFRTRRATLNPGERLASPSLPHQQRHSRAAGSCHRPIADIRPAAVLHRIVSVARGCLSSGRTLGKDRSPPILRREPLQHSIFYGLFFARTAG